MPQSVLLMKGPVSAGGKGGFLYLTKYQRPLHLNEQAAVTVG